MPTKNPRVTFTLDQETLNRIDDFRFSDKSKNQTQAILRLLDAGLSAFEPKQKKSPHQPKPVRGIYPLPLRQTRIPRVIKGCGFFLTLPTVCWFSFLSA